MVPQTTHRNGPALLIELLLGAIPLAAGAGGLRLALGLSPAVMGVALLAYAGLGLALWRQRGNVSLTPADRVTLGRGVLVMLLIGLIPAADALGQEPSLPFALALAAVLLDGLDGAVARRLGCATRAGARFDMELDALLLLVLGVWLVLLDRAGIWVLLIGAWRYVFVLGGWIDARLRRPLAPSQRRRVICAVQGLGLTLCLAPGLPPTLSAPLALVLFLLLSYSFLVDAAASWRSEPPTGDV